MILLLSWGHLASSYAAIPCNPDEAECKHKYKFSDKTSYISYFSNYDLDHQNSSIKRLLMVIQGNHRDPKNLLKVLSQATAQAQKTKETLIVTPWFKGVDLNGKSDQSETIEPNELFWEVNEWKIGGSSISKPNLSSFQIVDQMITEIVQSKLFPFLGSVVVTGHSAGGQFTQRYAFGSSIDRAVSPISVEYVVANPSSYLYLNELRPNWAGLFPAGGKYPESEFFNSAASDLRFQDPYIRTIKPHLKSEIFATIRNLDSGAECQCRSTPCPYERYKYGLDFKPQDPSHYMCFEKSKQKCNQTRKASDQITFYLSKRVTYILGQLDRLGESDTNEELDRSCSASFEGPDRLTRGTYYNEYLNLFGPHHHRLLFAPQVGHDSLGVYLSYTGQRAVFGGELPEKQFLGPAYQVIQKSSGQPLGVPGSKWIFTKIEGNEYRIQSEKDLRYLEFSNHFPNRATTSEYRITDL